METTHITAADRILIGQAIRAYAKAYETRVLANEVPAGSSDAECAEYAAIWREANDRVYEVR